MAFVHSADDVYAIFSSLSFVYFVIVSTFLCVLRFARKYFFVLLDVFWLSDANLSVSKYQATVNPFEMEFVLKNSQSTNNSIKIRSNIHNTHTHINSELAKCVFKMVWKISHGFSVSETLAFNWIRRLLPENIS